MIDYSNLFSSGKIGGLTANNRVAMPAVHLGLAENGAAGASLQSFYEHRARGGAGVITVGVCNTWAQGEILLKNALDLSSDRTVQSMSDLAGRVKQHGSLVGIQLCPLVGYNNPKWHPDLASLPDIIESVGHAANRAGQAGFDFVELLFSGGSLFSHFLSPAHNQWQIPGYCNGWEERLRAPLQAISSIRSAAGSELPVLARIHGHEFLDAGYGLEGAQIIAKALCESGVAAVNVTGGGHRTLVPQLTSHTPPLAFVSFARKIRDAVDVPVMAGGRIRTVEEAEAARAMGVDFVTMARALIVDPNWPNKARDDRSDETISCMACCACLDQAVTGKPVRCSLNPQTGHQSDVPEQKGEALPQKALVVGSGPAGLQAAWTLGTLGCQVTVREKAPRPGGRWALASKLNGRLDLGAPLRSFITRLTRLGVPIETNAEVTPESARVHKPDILVLAMGARPRHPDIPGLDSHPNVLHAEQAIARPGAIGNRVAIIGAGGVGMELAIHLAAIGEPGLNVLGYLARYGEPSHLEQALTIRSGPRVTLLRRRGYPGTGRGRSVRWTMMRDLDRLDIQVLDRCTYEEIVPQGVRIVNGRTAQPELVPADTIIIAAGYEPDAELVKSFEGIAPKTIVIGDALDVTNIGAAVTAAYDAIVSL